MAEYIDREELKKQLMLESSLGYIKTLEDVERVIDFILAADVTPVKHGKWVSKEYESVSKRNRLIKYRVYSCSICGRSNGKIRKKYCPYCGAKMEGEEK